MIGCSVLQVTTNTSSVEHHYWGSDMQDFYRSPPSQPTDNAGTLSSQLSCVGDEHPKEWPKSNIKRFVSKFMKTFRTILQCYLIQINILGQFIAIIGVTIKWKTFLFSIFWLLLWVRSIGSKFCIASQNCCSVAAFMFSGGNWVNIILRNLFQFIPPPRRVNNKILIFMETFSDSFLHFYVSVFHSLLN